MSSYLDLVLPLGLGVGGDPVDAPDLGEHRAVAQREAEVKQPVGRRAHRREHGVGDLESWRKLKYILSHYYLLSCCTSYTYQFCVES